MTEPNDTYSLVLRGRFPGKDRAVAIALGQVFGREEAWGLQVVGASPITILASLTAAQAQAAAGALLTVEAKGCRFQIQDGNDNNCPTIHWPAAPRINGKLLDELSSSGAHPTASNELQMPCPHCGKHIHISITPTALQVPNPMGITAIPGTAAIITPARAPARYSMLPAIPVPKTFTGVGNTGALSAFGSAEPRAPTVLPTPLHTPQPMVRPDPNPPRLMRAPEAQHTSALETIQEIIVPDLDALDEISATATPIALPAVPMPRAPAALPEVPIVHSAPVPAPPLLRVPTAGSDPRMSGPMALEDFEAGLTQASVPHAPLPRPAHAMPVSADGVPSSNRASANAQQPDPDALCSVFIGRNSNPKVHTLVAEIQGITAREAEKLCQKALVSIVKDIPVSEAENIRQRLLKVGVNPRLTFRR